MSYSCARFNHPFAALVDNVKVECEAGGAVSGCCGSSDDNEFHFIIGEQSKQCLEVSHFVNVPFCRRVEALRRIPAIS